MIPVVRRFPDGGRADTHRKPDAGGVKRTNVRTKARSFFSLTGNLNRGDQRLLWNAIINWRAIVTSR